VSVFEVILLTFAVEYGKQKYGRLFSASAGLESII
jgi:hypothetical protein